jgi:uncharacterized protein (TIGR02246 family)
MQRRQSIRNILVMSGLLAACAPMGRHADESAIRSVLDAQQRAWNRGDIKAFMAGYDESDDIVFTSGGHVQRGFAATLARYQAAYGQDNQMGHLDFEVIEVRFLGSNSALVMGRFALSDTPKSGSGLFTLVFERREQGWRCIHDHTSADKKD